MPSRIADDVIDFYSSLFDRIFTHGFDTSRLERLRQKAVHRQVEEAADAASQTLTRFLSHQQFSWEESHSALSAFEDCLAGLKLDQVANANVSPELLTEQLLEKPGGTLEAGASPRAAAQRLALHSVVQTLLLVGPVMAEWQRLAFSSEFELPRKIVSRLNETSKIFEALGQSEVAVADERYELLYRDYILQRFYWVEAGTVRMTTNLGMDLRELFVPQNIVPLAPASDATGASAEACMDLGAARRLFQQDRKGPQERIPALEQVRRVQRNVLIGIPGSGKSTFLEWVQVKLAAAEEIMRIGGGQAIPILLRVRQLDARNLPKGPRMIEAATVSKDRSAVMPPGWVHRQMAQGRVLLMLDGLDEMEPADRDGYLLPWLFEMCKAYPRCSYIVSSRPLGYPPGALSKLEFAECQILDFDDRQVQAYTRHWCTAVRLAQNEPEKEARTEGQADGDRIVESFRHNPYIRDLARNPLMLSAICLVNYFEKGELPKDRALLYRLCVEGLLHNWDQRRGIRSEFGLEDKLRACREVAIAMQADDRAEYEAAKVQQIFEQVFGDAAVAGRLLEHIRYRTGLLIERWPRVFAFAHLTFQEYLAARAVYEGNLRGIDADRIASEPDNPRWHEVIPLFCGSVPAAVCRSMLEHLIAQPDAKSFEVVLGESFLAAPKAVTEDKVLRQSVIERICHGPFFGGTVLERFPSDEVAASANRVVGTLAFDGSGAFAWLKEHFDCADLPQLIDRIMAWRSLTLGVAELNYLLHKNAPDEIIGRIAELHGFYDAPGPRGYSSQADLAFLALSQCEHLGHGRTQAMKRILATVTDIADLRPGSWVPVAASDRRELAEVLRSQLKTHGDRKMADRERPAVQRLRRWLEALEG